MVEPRRYAEAIGVTATRVSGKIMGMAGQVAGRRIVRE
jgi:hypothetical protein